MTPPPAATRAVPAVPAAPRGASAAPSLAADFAEDVRRGLTAARKSLPPRWFYDDLGSVLFDAITQLPEYYLTRTERGILERHADDIVREVRGEPVLVELGSGSGAKTTLLLQALLRRQGDVRYSPIDISEGALRAAAANVARDLPDVRVRPIVGRYRPALATLRGASRPKLAVFLGSSIGNFDPSEATALLRDVAQVLAPGDRLLLGVDMDKAPDIVHAAYNDALGVTAAFNRNLLVRINRELDGDLDVGRFAHRATFRRDAHRVETDLVSLAKQEGHLAALGLRVRFAEGEALRTEHSYKYTPELLADIVHRAGLRSSAHWTDARGWFGLHLLAPAGTEP